MIKSRKELCICPTCPTYDMSNLLYCAGEKNESQYCTMGRSPTCITEEISCLCPDCPVTKQAGLEHDFFCTRGSEKEQRAKSEKNRKRYTETREHQKTLFE